MVILPAGFVLRHRGETAKTIAGWLIMMDGGAASYLGVGGQTAKIHRRVVRFFNLPHETGCAH